MNKTIEVVAAILVKEHRVLCTKRKDDAPLPGLWEFPGGKIEPGETPESALKREIREELSGDIRILEPFTTVHHDYPTFSIILHTYICEWVGGALTLIEHAEKCWADRNDLLKLEFAPADRPVVRALVHSEWTTPKGDVFS